MTSLSFERTDAQENEPHLPVAVGLEFVWTPPNVNGFTYNMDEGEPQIDCSNSARCEGQIPGSPMNYLSTFGKLELLESHKFFMRKLLVILTRKKSFQISMLIMMITIL